MTSGEPATLQTACPACLTANRLPATRADENPKCGQCGAPLLEPKPAELDEKAFESFVARTTLPVIADFWAPWCGPCRSMAPHFERAAAESGASARFVKVNSDEAPNLSVKYRIRAIPTVILFRNGAEVDRFSGARDAGAIRRWVESHA